MKFRNEEVSEEWYKSWGKWSGDLWGRLTYFYKYTRKEAFNNLLWHECSYCRNFECCDCPLFQMSACNPYLKEPSLTGKMYRMWIEEDEEGFKRTQQEFLDILWETRW